MARATQALLAQVQELEASARERDTQLQRLTSAAGGRLGPPC